MSFDDIIQRLATVKGPDREIDTDIAIAFNHLVERDWWSMDYLKAGLVPAFTSSVDAAIALLERELPDHGRIAGKGRCSEDEPLFGCAIFATAAHKDDDEPIGVGEHNCEPMAYVMALLCAVQSKGVVN